MKVIPIAINYALHTQPVNAFLFTLQRFSVADTGIDNVVIEEFTEQQLKRFSRVPTLNRDLAYLYAGHVLVRASAAGSGDAFRQDSYLLSLDLVSQLAEISKNGCLAFLTTATPVSLPTCNPADLMRWLCTMESNQVQLNSVYLVIAEGMDYDTGLKTQWQCP